MTKLIKVDYNAENGKKYQYYIMTENVFPINGRMLPIDNLICFNGGSIVFLSNKDIEGMISYAMDIIKDDKKSGTEFLHDGTIKIYNYLITDDCGNYKIGLSQSPTHRLKQLSREFKTTLRLLHFFPSDNPIESEEILHMKYLEKHLDGEWFALDNDDIQYIISIKEYSHGKFMLT